MQNTAVAISEKSNIQTFLAVVSPCADSPGYWARCDAFDGGCTVQGITMRETQSRMLEAMAFYLEDYPDVVDYVLLFEVRNA